MEKCQHINRLAARFNKEEFKELNEEMSFSDYLDKVYDNPALIRTAYQRLYDMVTEQGSQEIQRYKKKLIHYNFFDDPEIPIFGLEDALDELVKFFKGAAGGYGTEKRVLLLHGPVGSSKSTILRRIKKGLENYSRRTEGSWYSFKWVNLPTGQDGIFTSTEDECPMHEEPLKLIPLHMRKKVVQELNEIYKEKCPDDKKNSLYSLTCIGELDPRCRKFMSELMKRNDGDWHKVVEKHIRVIRKVYSEADRCGIATFQPKDEKNQDATELTGDINFRNIGHFGTDSDPRAFNFDGEFCFPAGSMVRMANGCEKVIEQVAVGDKVVTHTGGCCSVVDTFKRNYTGDLITLNIRSFPFPISMTANHPVAVLAGRCDWRWQPGELIWKEAGDLTEDDRVIIGYNQQINNDRLTIDLAEIMGENFIDIKNDDLDYVKLPYSEYKNALLRHVSISPSFARFFGLYLAEGGCYEEKKVVFNLSAKEGDLANEIIALGRGLFGINGTTRIVNERKTGRVVEFHNINLVKIIKHFVPGNVYSKRIPSLFFACDEQVKLALLLGWLDGDGFDEIRSTKNKPSVRITGVTSSKNLARDMTVLALSCGLVATVSKRKARKQSKVSYAVDLSNRKALNLIPELALKAKDNGIKLWEKDSNRSKFGYVRRVKNIERTSVVDMPVYDFEVEEDHSFLVNDVIVHNCVGNRGIVEFIEMLKLAQEFLYDLLGASQERQIKPKKFAQISIDEAIIGHTNTPEYDRLRNNQYMEALKDRTVKIDVPYLLRWSDEIKVLEQDYNTDKVKQHVAPHTLEIAALWAILTRLDEDKDGKLTLVQKVRLYNGEALPGYTEDTVGELRDKHPNEGMASGVSARYTQDKISNCLSNNHDYISPFMVLHEIKSGLENNTLISKKEDVAKYNSCVDLAVKELDEILKDEVRKALVGDEKVIERLCANYIDNIMAYIRKSKIKNKLTGRDEPPNERLMRSIEEKIGIPDQGVDDFRRMVAAFIGDMATDGKKFRWDSNSDLKKALEAKLFEDTRDHIKLSALNVSEATVVAPDVQDKIDAIKKRLIDQYGYNDKSASDVLDYVGSLFARTAMDDDD